LGSFAHESQGQSISTLYNKIENAIMEVLARELAGVDHWFVHDGFMTKSQISKPGLEDAIKVQTGYDIKLEKTDLCQSE
jgi:hypothetical protein